MAGRVVGESRPITVVFHSPPFIPFVITADQPNEPIINSPQYCDDSGSHRWSVQLPNWKVPMDYMGLKFLIIGIYAGNDYGPVTNQTGAVTFTGLPAGTSYHYVPIEKNPTQTYIYAPGLNAYLAEHTAFMLKFYQAQAVTDWQLRLNAYYQLANQPTQRPLVESLVLPAIYDMLTSAGRDAVAAVTEMADVIKLSTHLLVNMLEIHHAVGTPAEILAGPWAGATMRVALTGWFALGSTYSMSHMFASMFYDAFAPQIQDFLQAITDPKCFGQCAFGIPQMDFSGFWQSQMLFPMPGGFTFEYDWPAWGNGLELRSAPAPFSMFIPVYKRASVPPPQGLAHTWVPTTSVAMTITAAKNTCSAMGMSTPTISAFRADHAKAKAVGKTIQSMFNVQSQLHWLVDDVSCASAGSACYYRPGQEAAGNEAQMVQAFSNDAAGNGNSGWGAFVMCVH